MDPPLAISVRVSISLIGLGLGERDGAAESDGQKGPKSSKNLATAGFGSGARSLADSCFVAWSCE